MDTSRVWGQAKLEFNLDSTCRGWAVQFLTPARAVTACSQSSRGCRAAIKDGQVVLDGAEAAAAAAAAGSSDGAAAAAAAEVTLERFVIPSQLRQHHLEVCPRACRSQGSPPMMGNLRCVVDGYIRRTLGGTLAAARSKLDEQNPCLARLLARAARNKNLMTLRAWGTRGGCIRVAKECLLAGGSLGGLNSLQLVRCAVSGPEG